MGFSTVLIIAFAAGAILVVGGGLMVYMGNLVRSAYEIKVQINTEVEERLTKMGEDLDKKSRWIKRDLLEEIGKIKEAMQVDNARKIGELADPLVKRIEALESLVKSSHTDLVKAIESDRASIAALDQKMKAVRAQPAAKDPKPEAGSPAAEALDQAMASMGMKDGEAKPAPAAEPAPAKPAGPQPISDTLPHL